MFHQPSAPVSGSLAPAVAVLAFGMPADLALLSGTEGITFGLVPIMWIVVNAIWLHQLTVVTGWSDDLTIAAAAVGLAGMESEIFRRVIWWSLGLLVVMCLLIGLQSTPVRSWMLPG